VVAATAVRAALVAGFALVSMVKASEAQASSTNFVPFFTKWRLCVSFVGCLSGLHMAHSWESDEGTARAEAVGGCNGVFGRVH
jgi:hypothetical protein